MDCVRVKPVFCHSWGRLVTVGILLSALAALPLSGQQAFLKTYCLACHQGEKPAAGLDVGELGSAASFREQPDTWTRIAARVRNSEMPPRGALVPAADEREDFLAWAERTWRAEACAADLAPPPSPTRRLNREEHAATLRDLFDIQLDVSESLPVDGPGGEGFDNAAETLFLSPLHSEKLLDVSRLMTESASKEFKSRSKIFVSRPGSGTSEIEAARRILTTFLPQAFRRPVGKGTVDSYLKLFRRARAQGRPFEPAIFFALQGALVSPRFLFHVTGPEVSEYAVASRFSYFLWGTMPDELLFDTAAAGKMSDPEVLRKLVPKMLRDPRSLEFAERFVEQWLRTRELDRGGPSVEELSDYIDLEDLRSDIRLQPVFFFQHVFREDLSLLSFLESDHTILTRSLDFHLGIKREQNSSKNPTWLPLDAGSNRGGLLGMPAVLAVSSHPTRTSPVLRGTWILDSILGAPPPPPPPDVPDLEAGQTDDNPKSMRELLALHRADAVCASCHNRIDPLGFALENYDVLGRRREEDAGLPIDASSELMDGTPVDGPAGLKNALLDRKDSFVRNLTRRLLGYALGRGLTPADACAVETIVERVKSDDYTARTLIEEIVVSAPFRAPHSGAQ